MKLYPFLKDNIEALQKHSERAYRWLSTQTTDPTALEENIIINKWGQLDWKMPDGSGLVEPFPPGMLYKDWKMDEKAHSSATIIVGANLGYGINHVLMNTPDTHKVVVIEPDPNILLACLGQTDYRPFMDIQKLHFCEPTEEYLDMVVRHLDLQFVYGKIMVRSDLASQQLGPQYAKWVRTVRNHMENYSVELTTLRYKQDIMVGNELKNFNRSVRDGSLKKLEGTGKGIGAVILGAGPSLAQWGPKLAEKKNNALFVTALQTMPACKNVGIKPHLCMAIDYDDSMNQVYDRLDREWAKDVPLIYSTKVNPKVVDNYPGPTIPLWTLGGMATFCLREHDLIIDAGGNVSVTLMRFLSFIGVEHMLLVGQDFAWTGENTHTAGHHASGSAMKFNPRRHMKLKNLDGDEIITSMQYITSVRDMEKDIAENRLTVYNLYGGGVDIKGTKPLDLDTAYAKGLLSSSPGSVDGFLSSFDRARARVPRPVFEARGSIWAASLRNVEKRLAKLLKKPGKNQKEIHQVFDHASQFLKSDTLYLPYLFNEILNMSGLARARFKYEPKDLAEFRRISKKVMDKVREIDRIMGQDRRKKAA